MTRICIQGFALKGAVFAQGCEYDADYNPYLHCYVISHPLAGDIEISRNTLNTFFL